MNKLEEIRGYLDMNEEIEFRYNGLECFVTPNNVVWEFWINDECVIKEPDLDTFLMIPCLEGHTISDILLISYMMRNLCTFFKPLEKVLYV